ncbi:MAG: hypothetical protein IJA87_04385 [Clostridia bacterium]|nr:hypothetical protein [Clostridia bacterium]
MKSFCVLNKPLNKKTGEALGSAAVAAFGCKTGFLHDGSDRSAAVASYLAKGVKSAGAVAISFGCINESAIPFLAQHFGLSCAFFVGRAQLVSVYNSLGKPLSVCEEEKISSLVLSQDKDKKRGGEMIYINPSDSYLKALADTAQNLEDICAGVESQNKSIKNMLCSVLNLLGGAVGSKPRFFVSNSGFCVSACDECGRKLTHEELLNICCAEALKKGSELSVAFSAPDFLDDIAAEHGVRLERSFDGGKELWQSDGLFLVAKLLRLMAEQGKGLSSFYNTLPPVNHRRKNIVIEKDICQIADSISCDEVITDDSRGVFVRMKQGSVLVTPYRNSPKVCMEILAANSEIADELEIEMCKQLTT